MQIRYGTLETNIDVTDICSAYLRNDTYIIIPAGDRNRANFFGDPCVGIQKQVFIQYREKTYGYSENYHLRLLCTLPDNGPIIALSREEVFGQLANIQTNIQMKHGKITEEIPEQTMTLLYMTGKETVLEIGGNMGRNSLLISALLGNRSSCHLVLESDSEIAQQLAENRDLNRAKFAIEPRALSKRPLVQREWNTYPSEECPEGYKWVNAITLEELREKYPIPFDTLILDCEGAFYPILMDMPEVLDGIQLIIMENDYQEISHKQYVDEVLASRGFACIYAPAGGWGHVMNIFTKCGNGSSCRNRARIAYF